MNNSPRPSHWRMKSFHLLDELSLGGSLTQRQLSGRLGMALGMVNSHIRSLVTEGMVTVKAVPPNRYLYRLTPRGLAEKTRLSYLLLGDYTRVHREARSGLKAVFAALADKGVQRVVLAGADEAAELAYLALHEAGMKLAGVVDRELAGGKFLGRRIKPLSAVGGIDYDQVVVASFLKRESLRRGLLASGVRSGDICVVFPA
ncbi:MAG: winged helix-turn-helix transcriptional regulator [Thermodesulfovibrionales bacterium]